MTDPPRCKAGGPKLPPAPIPPLDCLQPVLDCLRRRQTRPDEAATAAALGQQLSQADGDRFPNREATLGQALDRYLKVADLEVSTREAHDGYVRRTIRPVLGEVKIRKLGADSLDALYTALNKCSRLCRRLLVDRRGRQPRTVGFTVTLSMRTTGAHDERITAADQPLVPSAAFPNW